MFWETDFFKSFPKHFYFQLKISNLIFFNKTKVAQNIFFLNIFCTFALSKKAQKTTTLYIRV